MPSLAIGVAPLADQTMLIARGGIQGRYRGVDKEHRRGRGGRELMLDAAAARALIRDGAQGLYLSEWADLVVYV